MKELVLYFCDDKINILYNGRVITKKLESIKNGLVVDRLNFMESFLDILKKEKIKSKLFGDKIYVVKDVYFNERDMFFLDTMFIELGFIKVIFWDIRKILDNNYTYIGVFKDYMVYYLDNPIVIRLDYFKDILKMIEYFKDYYRDYIVLFGSNDNILNMKSKILSLYYVDNYQNYITDSLLQVKKYGV